MKDVLLSNAGVQVYIIDGSRRTDAAARAVITALYNAGRVCKDAAERAKNDRATLDKIKRNMLHVQMEERETETGKRWTFYTAGCVYMDISAYSRNYIRADKQGNIYPAEAPTEEEPSTTGQDTTCTDREPQTATQSAETTADDTTTAGSDADHTEASQDAQKATQSEGTTSGGQTITAEGNEAQRATQSRKEDEAGKSITPPHNEPPRASQSPTEAASNAEPGRVSQSPAEPPQGQERTAGGQRTTGTDTRPPQAAERATTPHRTRGAPRKVTFSAWMPKIDPIPM